MRADVRTGLWHLSEKPTGLYPPLVVILVPSMYWRPCRWRAFVRLGVRG